MDSHSDNKKHRKYLMIAAVVFNIGMLGFFKYSGMVASVFGQAPAWVSSIALPLGISFYTFQLLTYVVDVYRGDVKCQKSYYKLLLYVSMFPQLIAGPIVRYEIKGLSSIDIPYVEYNDKQYRLNKETDDIYTSENIAFNGNVTDIVLHIGTYSYSGKIKISAAAEEDDLFNI